MFDYKIGDTVKVILTKGEECLKTGEDKLCPGHSFIAKVKAIVTAPAKYPDFAGETECSLLLDLPRIDLVSGLEEDLYLPDNAKFTLFDVAQGSVAAVCEYGGKPGDYCSEFGEWNLYHIHFTMTQTAT